MKDFTLSCYVNYLWNSDLLQLKCENGNFFFKPYNDVQKIRFVSTFGTVIEVKDVNEKCSMVTVDDGTGAITCRYSISDLSCQLQDWSWTLPAWEKSLSESLVRDRSFDDSVFNDRTVQIDDIKAEADADMKASEALRCNIIDSFSRSEKINIGDIVQIHGKLYSYFGSNQIYVNVIRRMTMKEEFVLTRIKLCHGKNESNGRGVARILEPNDIPTSEEIGDAPSISGREEISCTSQNISNCSTSIDSKRRRTSGLMTFDTLSESRRLSTQSLESIPHPVHHTILLVSPPNITTFTTYDTVVIEEDVSSASSDSDDVIIPETPQRRRSS